MFDKYEYKPLMEIKLEDKSLKILKGFFDKYMIITPTSRIKLSKEKSLLHEVKKFLKGSSDIEETIKKVKEKL